MNTIIAITSLLILVLLLPVLLIIGLVKPRLILRWSKKPARWKVLGWWFLATFVCLSVFGFAAQAVESAKLRSDVIYAAKQDIIKSHYDDALDKLRQIAPADPRYAGAQEQISIVFAHAQADKKTIARDHAADALSDEQIMAKILKNTTDINIAKKLAARMTSTQLLADLAKNASYKPVCDIAAVELARKTGDQSALAAMATNIKNDIKLREAAADAITDQSILCDIVKTSANDETTQIAFARLDDPRLLAGLARDATALRLRLMATWRLADKTALGELAKNAPDNIVRKAAAASLGELASPQGKPASINILDLINTGKVTATVSGAGLTSVFVRLERMTPQPLEVEIPAGTWFFNRNPAATSMVSTEAARILHGLGVGDKWNSWENHISAASAEMSKDTPSGDDSLAIIAAPGGARGELAKLMPTLAFNNANAAIKQAAVWIVTDNASYYSLVSLRWVPVGGGGEGVQAVKEAEAVEAMQICAAAGIDITKKEIWSQRAEMLASLKPGDLKTWLENYIKP